MPFFQKLEFLGSYTLRVFGSTAYYHVKESKLDPRAKKKIISSRDVTFDESAMLKKVTTDGKVS